MSAVSLIKQVIVYSGHEKTQILGPYAESVTKRVAMFKQLNPYREEMGRPSWNVRAVAGERLVETLKEENAEETLLVIPAGQSSRLEQVFSTAQLDFLRDIFFKKGGRAYFTCGASYWVSRTRVYHEVCLDRPDASVKMVKQSTFPIFQGKSVGPLCKFPGAKYKVGFYSDAVEVEAEGDCCSIYLSGGGSLMPDPEPLDGQRVRVLVRYRKEELLRLGVKEEKIAEKERAVIMVSVGKGAALLSMFHPYYSSSDIDVEAYERAFPDCGTDWRKVHEKLSPTDQRMRFVLQRMLNYLEEMTFNSGGGIMSGKL